MIRAHILMAFLILVATACASREDVSQSEIQRRQQLQEEFTLRELETGSRVR
jgi:hypothetical protein